MNMPSPHLTDFLDFPSNCWSYGLHPGLCIKHLSTRLGKFRCRLHRRPWMQGCLCEPPIQAGITPIPWRQGLLGYTGGATRRALKTHVKMIVMAPPGADL